MSTTMSNAAPFANSTIFKRHETRNNSHAQKASGTTMAIKPIDGTLGETLAQLWSNRSTIFQMHSKRHESHEDTRQTLPKMTAGSQYQGQLSLGSMTKISASTNEMPVVPNCGRLFEKRNSSLPSQDPTRAKNNRFPFEVLENGVHVEVNPEKIENQDVEKKIIILG
eukprot:CAMPEP_0116845524 /NCGR_PEP_ID=MMETSP0418-20121206/13316_1 /TAXON_ID=1158023 /ORGANISM="Astrosyne radiata, Strain 13vi08-1A" /LENGTH=166 /DNA_ID=CAMNT_0004476647 /DNA_START=20 /DNA_END=517 /DNA_ORIENTATION=-